jgi:hypothetical protein
MFEADYNKRIREVEQKRKEQLLEDEERKVLQLQDAKQKQQVRAVRFTEECFRSRDAVRASSFFILKGKRCVH